MRALIAGIFLVSSALAADAQNVAVLCRAVLPAMDTKNFQGQLFSWATGFVTGINLSSQANGIGYRDLSKMNFDVVVGQVRLYCAQNPDKPIVGAIEPMYRAFPVVGQ